MPQRNLSRNRVRRSLRRLRARVRRLSWLSVAAFLLSAIGVTLVTVSGGRAGDRLTWFDNVADPGDADLHRAVEDRYRAEGLAPGEHVYVEQYRHGWPVTFLTRAVGRVVNLKRNGAAAAPTFVRGHRRTEPLLSVSLPASGEAFAVSKRLPGGGMELTPVDWKTTPIVWTDYHHWPIAADAADWRWGALLANLALLLGLPIAAVAATEWWVRRRGGALRLRLTDLLVIVAAVSAVFGWRQSHASLRSTEASIERQGHAWLFPRNPLRDEWERRRQGKASGIRWRREFRGPEGLARLLGNREILLSTWHVTTLQLTPNASWRDNVDRLDELLHLEWVSFPRGVSRRAIAALAKLPRLRRVDVAVGTPPRAWASETPIDPVDDNWLGPADLAELAALPVEELRVMGEALLAEDLRRVASIPTLRRLHVIDAAVLPREEGELRRAHPDVEFTFAWGQLISSSFGSSTRFVEDSPRGMEHRVRAEQERRGENDR